MGRGNELNVAENESFGLVFVEAKNDLALNTRIKSLGFIFDADSLAIAV
jgi:hypothetical protein